MAQQPPAPLAYKSCTPLDPFAENPLFCTQILGCCFAAERDFAEGEASTHLPDPDNAGVGSDRRRASLPGIEYLGGGV